MWYVIQVYTGKEEEGKKLCRTYIEQEILNDCFCPKYECTFKKKGERKIVRKTLFPGYIFLDTEYPEQVYPRLIKIPAFTKLLRTGETWIPLTTAEQNFIKKHGNAEHIFEMSRGYMVGDEVTITEGAFEGFQGRLKHVDRHNRYGVIEVDMFGAKTEVRFGLEIISKVP